MFECCLLSGRGPCDGLITRPEKSYRLWRVVVCDQETSYARAAKYNPQWVAFKQDQDGTSSILVQLESCLQTCMTYTIAECIVNKLLTMDRGAVRNM